MAETQTTETLHCLNQLSTEDMLAIVLDGNQAYEIIQDSLNFQDKPDFDQLKRLYRGLATIALLCELWVPDEEFRDKTTMRKSLGSQLCNVHTASELDEIRGYYDKHFEPITAVSALYLEVQELTKQQAARSTKFKISQIVGSIDPIEVERKRQRLLDKSAFDETNFMDYGNCNGVDPDLFFPDRGVSTREAKEVCRGCVVSDECLEYAIVNEEKHGIWGGKSERERRKLRKQRRLAGLTQSKYLRADLSE